MKYRNLGRTGLDIAPIMLGGNVFGWTIDKTRSFDILDAFVDAGFNAIDTADMYSRWIPGHEGGESETIIGDWLTTRKCRDKVVIATKFGLEMGDGMKGLGKAYMTKAVDACLQRLKTDYIDLFQAHFDDPETPVQETMEGFDALIRSGKVRAIGASNFTPGRLKESLETSDRLGLARYGTYQPPYNLCDRAGYESELAPLCEREGLAVITYYSLASGFLTGKYRSLADLEGTARAHTNKKYLNPRGERILSVLSEQATKHSATMAQIALAWIMTRPAVAAPIVSATSIEQLNDILGAVDVRLAQDDLTQLDAASRND